MVHIKIYVCYFNNKIYVHFKYSYNMDNYLVLLLLIAILLTLYYYQDKIFGRKNIKKNVNTKSKNSIKHKQKKIADSTEYDESVKSQESNISDLSKDFDKHDDLTDLSNGSFQSFKSNSDDISNGSFGSIDSGLSEGSLKSKNSSLSMMD